MKGRQWLCCTPTVKIFYLLSVLVVLVCLVNQSWLSKSTGRPWGRHSPVVYGGSEPPAKAKVNMSSQHSQGRFVSISQLIFKADANISSREKEDVSSAKGHPSFNKTLAASVDGKLPGTLTHGPFPYIINEPDKCTESRPVPFLVLLITTEARQLDARNAIRQTWGSDNMASALGFIRLFLLGKNEGELGLLQQKMLETESQRYHDIIQQDFLDTYKNLTIKTMMGINWVAIHCPQASYVMKTDSDMFVNTEYLIHKLLRPEIQPRKNYFTGSYMAGYEPIRNKNSKWYMPPELYPGAKYPTFCSGTGYVFSGHLAREIYQASLTIPYLHLEDVYMGICLAKLQIKPTPSPSASLFNHWRVPYSSCKYNQLITSHGFHPNELLKYWHHLQSNKHNTCINTVGARASRVHSHRMHRGKPLQ